MFLAGPTGFEPAISSVTGRRDRPSSLRTRKLSYNSRVDCKFQLFLSTCYNNFSLFAAVAQLVERRTRNA